MIIKHKKERIALTCVSHSKRGEERLIKLIRILAALILTVILILMLSGSARAEEERPIAVIYTESYMADLNSRITEAGISPEAVATQKDHSAATAADFVYLKELPLSARRQQRLYELWTGAGYDYTAALAIADIETGGTFNISAVNEKSHDYGLFQLNRRSWLGTFKRELGISRMEEMLDFELNVRGALIVYADAVSRYGETEKVFVAYNMGEAKVSSTPYSRMALEKQEKYRRLIEEAGKEQK